MPQLIRERATPVCMIALWIAAAPAMCQTIETVNVTPGLAALSQPVSFSVANLLPELNLLPNIRPYMDLPAFMQPTPPVAVYRSKTPDLKVKRSSIDPSMVGYIENPGVHSEVRVRFDAALHDDTPDRAEFFYGKCGCYKGATGLLADTSAPGPGPGVPRYVNFQQLYFLGEYAAHPRVSIFTQIPLRWLQPTPQPGQSAPFASSGGISDIQLGVKFAAIASGSRTLTLQLRTTVPSGDASRGLGTNHASVEPAVLFYQQLTDRLAVEAEFGDNHPIGGSKGIQSDSPHGFAGDVIFYGAGPSYRLVDNEQFRLASVLEVVGWNVRGGYVTGPTSTDGVNIVNLKIGPRISFGAHSSFYAGYGIALTSQNWYREIFRTEYRYAF